MAEFQTLAEFIQAPFGNKDSNEEARLEQLYQGLKSRIKIEGYTIIDDDYFLHITIPSDSNKNQSYDVVIMFFTDEKSVKSQITIKNYYIKLFSNSPSFIYKYAALYHTEGYLIDFLFEKLDKDYADVLPVKSTSDFKLSYDKSTYAAARYLLDDKLISLSKFGMVTKHKKESKRFFSDIKTFRDVKFGSELNTIDKKIDKELAKNKEEKKKKSIAHNTGKRVSAKSTVRDGEKFITKCKVIRSSKGSSNVSKVKRITPKKKI